MILESYSVIFFFFFLINFYFFYSNRVWLYLNNLYNLTDGTIVFLNGDSQNVSNLLSTSSNTSIALYTEDRDSQSFLFFLKKKWII